MSYNLLRKLPEFYIKEGKTYETKTNKEVKKYKKTFRIKGWYKYNDEKEFWTHTLSANNIEEALKEFTFTYYLIDFYKIDIKEIL
jgi:hypothetical protein